MISLRNQHCSAAIGRYLFLCAALCASQHLVIADSFSSRVFAVGGPVGGTEPDSVSFGNGSLWIEYGNGAPSTNYTDTSTIVQYSMSGSVEHTDRISGQVDGLKYDPYTGLVWALQNQDANSSLTIINPGSSTTTHFTYGAPYTSVSSYRGFDDIAFIGNNVYMSETNPANTSQPVIVKLDNPTPSSPITLTTVLTGVGILATDPDSLKSTPSEGLVLTGEADTALTFVSNPGLPSQTARSLPLISAAGGSPDDSIYPTASSGTFYIADTGANVVYALSATGLTAGSLFVDIGPVFGSVNTTTGVVTPIFTGQSLHGMDFVPSAPAPEPTSITITLFGLLCCAIAISLKRLSGRR
jgi:hypothetical protein